MNRITGIIHFIIYYVTELEGYINKTKLVKYLYLIDLMYYRRHKKTYTDFKWKFFHYGPHTFEFEEYLNELLQKGIVVSRMLEDIGKETTLFKCEEEIDASSLFPSVTEELEAKRIIKEWAQESLNKMLDYVYFNTEPMKNAGRGEYLDFSKIFDERYRKHTTGDLEKFQDGINNLNLERINYLFERFKERKTKGTKSVQFENPRYDDVFLEAIAKMNKEDNRDVKGVSKIDVRDLKFDEE